MAVRTNTLTALKPSPISREAKRMEQTSLVLHRNSNDPTQSAEPSRADLDCTWLRESGFRGQFK